MVLVSGLRVGAHEGAVRALDPVMSGPLHWPGDYRLCTGEARGGGRFVMALKVTRNHENLSPAKGRDEIAQLGFNLVR